HLPPKHQPFVEAHHLRLDLYYWRNYHGDHCREPVRLRDASWRHTRATRSIQSLTPRRAHWCGLPLLSYDRGSLCGSRNPSHQDLHELSFADLVHEPDAGTGAGQLSDRQISSLDTGSRSARLRLLQPQYSREQGRGLQHLSWTSGSHALGLAACLAADGVVSGLPQAAAEVRPPSGSSL